MQVITDECKFVFDNLEKYGYECYAVGGCVRDILLGLKPHDIDFTTNATPDEILDCFKDYKIFDLGKKYGTISVLNNGAIYEITTYRVDGKYTDSRHPDKVDFSNNLRDDLSRRDFTINAMAMDKEGNILDIFGGKKDLENKLIRTVGNPEDRFTEDALRIFRALRFSAKLGFNIEKDTSFACKKMCFLLKNLHPQRLRDELMELLLSDNVAEVLSEYRNVFASIVPEIEPTFNFKQITVHHRYDVFMHTIYALKISPKIPEVRFALLFHDIAKPLCHLIDKAGISHFKGHPEKSADITTEILSKFGFRSDFVNRVKILIELHDHRFENTRVNIKRILSKITCEDFENLLIIQRCDILAQSEYLRDEKLSHIDNVEKEFRSIIDDCDCIALKDLAVNGTDLSNLGASGKKIGEILDTLLQLVIEEKLNNEKDVLLNYAENMMSD